MTKYLTVAFAALAFTGVNACALGGDVEAVAPDGRIDVRGFGAVGDGAHDDTVALQKALDKVDEFRRRDIASWGEGMVGSAAPEIVLPAGTYRITRPLVAVRTFSLRGEKGAVIDAAGVKGPALYIDRAYRCTVEGMTFRNGESHVAFWTHNDDSATILIRDCRFENAAKEAVWTESWSTEPTKDAAGKVVKRPEYVAPFEVVRDESGMPVLKPLVWKRSAPNSTQLGLHDCTFVDCSAAYRGYTDGQCLSRLWFRSSKTQTLPPFKTSTEARMTDIRILACIPEGFVHGYVEAYGSAGNFVLTRINARSLSKFGAPLLVTYHRPRTPGGKGYEMARHVDVRECVADSANSPSCAFLDFRRREPALLHVRGCTEAKGAKVRLVHVGEIPTDIESMRDVGGQGENNVPLELTHRWLFEDNDACFDLRTPDIFAPCFEKPLPYAALAGFPEADAKIESPRSQSSTVFRACDYGIGIGRKKMDETKELEILFAAAAKAENPLVELPGRTIGLSRTITLPRRISIQGAGRAVLCGLNPSNDIFKVESGVAPLAIDFDNVGLVNGAFALTASGKGRIHFQNGVLVRNRGFKLVQTCGTLDATVVDSMIFCAQLAQNDGATFRVRDSWCEFLAADYPYTYIVNRRGTVSFERICGVPITAMDASDIKRPAGLPKGEYMFWIRNENGVVATREFRYGGEFGGISPLDNYGSGCALIETGFTMALNGGTIPCIFRNNSPEGRITVNRALLLGIGWVPPHVGHGVRPQEEWRSGLRLERDRYENLVQGTKQEQKPRKKGKSL